MIRRKFRSYFRRSKKPPVPLLYSKKPSRAGFSITSSAKRSSIIRSIEDAFRVSRAAAKAGVHCMISPIERSLINRTFIMGYAFLL